MRKFWIWVAVLGIPVFIGGLVWTIILTNETGEVRPDSECSTTMRATVTALDCVVSNDPKVLLGVAPLLLGLAMTGIGIWRAIVTPGPEGSSGGGGGLFGSIRALQQQAMEMQESAMGTMSAGDTSGAPTSPPAAPSAQPSAPPTPPAPKPPGE